jgi:hypothetical protein
VSDVLSAVPGERDDRLVVGATVRVFEYDLREDKNYFQN